MAEITSSETSKRKRQYKRKLLSTRVDLTPMVDLGFLLITFFIFTTTMTESKTMGVVVPSDEPVKNPSLAAETRTISLVLGDRDAIYYYHGLAQKQTMVTDYSASGIRTVLQQKIEQVNRMTGKEGETIVLIKPTENASYRNVVDVLDEMLINSVRKYVLMDADPGDPVSSAGHSLPRK